jgi:hypothetical protein
VITSSGRQLLKHGSNRTISLPWTFEGTNKFSVLKIDKFTHRLELSMDAGNNVEESDEANQWFVQF